MEKGTNYFGTSTPAEGTITIEKGTLTLALTAVNRSTGVQRTGRDLEPTRMILISLQVFRERMVTNRRVRSASMTMGMHPDTISVGEAGTAVLNLPKPGVASVERTG